MYLITATIREGTSVRQRLFFSYESDFDVPAAEYPPRLTTGSPRFISAKRERVELPTQPPELKTLVWAYFDLLVLHNGQCGEVKSWNVERILKFYKLDADRHLFVGPLSAYNWFIAISALERAFEIKCKLSLSDLVCHHSDVTDWKEKEMHNASE